MANSFQNNSDESYTRLIDTATGQEVWRIPHTDRVTAVAFSPDSRWLAIATLDGHGRYSALMLEARPRSLCMLEYQRLSRLIRAVAIFLVPLYSLRLRHASTPVHADSFGFIADSSTQTILFNTPARAYRLILRSLSGRNTFRMNLTVGPALLH
jgi:WD40 repeat protein